MTKAETSYDEMAKYEVPVLVPVGNLHDLLAGEGGTQCDSMNAEETGGNGKDCS